MIAAACCVVDVEGKADKPPQTDQGVQLTYAIGPKFPGEQPGEKKNF